jgi:hypothetical protein
MEALTSLEERVGQLRGLLTSAMDKERGANRRGGDDRGAFLRSPVQAL